MLYIDTDNLDKFRTHIDKFWQHVIFNYKSELSGTRT